MGKQVVGPAIQLTGADNIVTSTGNCLNGIGNCRHAGCHGQRTHTTFHLGQPLLQHRSGRIHDTGVDISSHLQVKQISTMLGVIEGVGCSLINGYSCRLGGSFGFVTVVQGQGFQFQL